MVYAVEKNPTTSFHIHNLRTVVDGVGFKSVTYTVFKNEVAVECLAVVSYKCVTFTPIAKNKLAKVVDVGKGKLFAVRIPSMYQVRHMYTCALVGLRVPKHILLSSSSTSVTLLIALGVALRSHLTKTSLSLFLKHVAFVGGCFTILTAVTALRKSTNMIVNVCNCPAAVFTFLNAFTNTALLTLYSVHSLMFFKASFTKKFPVAVSACYRSLECASAVAI